MTTYTVYPAEPLILTLYLEENSILVSKAILEALDSPKQVQLLINEDKKKLLLQPCTENDKEAVIIPQIAQRQFEMSGHALLKRIRKLTGWADNRPRVIYGEYMLKHKVVVFDLARASVAELGVPIDGETPRPY